MNKVIIVGQIQGSPQLVYSSKDNKLKLYRLLVKVEKNYKTKANETTADFINVKIWNSLFAEIEGFLDQIYIGLEGRIVSYQLPDNGNYVNELLANKIYQLGYYE